MMYSDELGDLRTECNQRGCRDKYKEAWRDIHLFYLFAVQQTRAMAQTLGYSRVTKHI